MCNIYVCNFTFLHLTIVYHIRTKKWMQYHQNQDSNTITYFGSHRDRYSIIIQGRWPELIVKLASVGRRDIAGNSAGRTGPPRSNQFCDLRKGCILHSELQLCSFQCLLVLLSGRVVLCGCWPVGAGCAGSVQHAGRSPRQGISSPRSHTIL